MFLSISQIEKAGTLQQKSKAGRVITNFIMFSREPDRRATHDNSCCDITDNGERK